MDSIKGISYYLNKRRRYQTHHRWQFFFQEGSSLVHCAYGTVQVLQHPRLIQHLSEKCDLSFPVLPGNAQVQVIWRDILKRVLIAYSIGNISVKNYQNLFTCVKVIASHRWEFFWDTVYLHTVSADLHVGLSKEKKRQFEVGCNFCQYLRACDMCCVINFPTLKYISRFTSAALPLCNVYLSHYDDTHTHSFSI